MSGAEHAVDDLVREMLWSARMSAQLRRAIPMDHFTHRAPVVAVIAQHDQEDPNAPARGPGRVLSIVQHTMNLARDVHANPDRYAAAAGINARRFGQIDPQLLRHARSVLATLPGLVTDAANDLDAELAFLDRWVIDDATTNAGTDAPHEAEPSPPATSRSSPSSSTSAPHDSASANASDGPRTPSQAPKTTRPMLNVTRHPAAPCTAAHSATSDSRGH